MWTGQPRIRIGQEYDRAWIRNYFYDGTVEATVYQRLDDRIASFESKAPFAGAIKLVGTGLPKPRPDDSLHRCSYL